MDKKSARILASIFATVGILLATSQFAHALDIDLSGEPFLGPENAPVRILLFYDFQCPYCAKASPILMDVISQYGNLIRLYAINVPSPGHAYAEPAAEAALTAHEKGKFWEAYKKLYANQADLSPGNLVKIGADIGLDEKTFSENIQNHKYREQIKRDFYQALNFGLRATPTIFINEVQLVGGKTPDVLKYYINRELEKKGIKSPVGPVAKPSEEKSVEPAVPQSMIYQVGVLKPVESKTNLKVGDKAPDFTLPTISGAKIRLSEYIGKKNIVLSFVPAAWTPVCSAQWPEYKENKNVFDKVDALLIGISADNIPSLYSWCSTMGDLWFPVASDFYPHGETAIKYGILRSNGVTERAIFVIDKKGVIRYIDVHDINAKPEFEILKKELEKLDK